MSTKLNAEELLRKRRQWSEQSSTCVSVTQDLIGYSDAIRELVEPRDRILQEMVDSLGSFKRYSERETMNSEDEDAILDNCDLVLAKAKEQFGITPTNQK